MLLSKVYLQNVDIDEVVYDSDDPLLRHVLVVKEYGNEARGLDYGVTVIDKNDGVERWLSGWTEVFAWR